MKFKAVAVVVFAFLTGCGTAQSGAESESAVSSLSHTNLRVECLKSIEVRDVRVRDRVTLLVQGKAVKLSRLRTENRAEKTLSSSDTFTGTNNTIYDGAVVKKTHARMLLTPAEHLKNNNGESNSTRLRHVLIEYSQGKVTVTGPDTKVILANDNCRTASF